MKKILLILAVAVSSLTANAKGEGAFYGNKFFDNWYVSLNGGAGAHTKTSSFFKNLNYNGGLRLGKRFTPYLGAGLEGNVYFGNKVGSVGGNISDGKFVYYSQIGIYGELNLMNTFGGYYGTPRKFEVSFIPGLAWGHNYGSPATQNIQDDPDNLLIGKLAFDFAYNFGKDKEWQVYLEPAINFAIAGIMTSDGHNDEMKMNLDRSYLNLNVGVAYKFKTSNGSHNFMLVEECDFAEIKALNNTINGLRSKNQEQSRTIGNLKKQVGDLQGYLDECKGQLQIVPSTAATTSTEPTPSMPTVFFACNSFNITDAQQLNVKAIAKIMKKHPEYDLLIKGYASIEGPEMLNKSLSTLRAAAVRKMLVTKYKISPYRIKDEGMGPTSDIYEPREFNRVAIMTLILRK